VKNSTTTICGLGMGEYVLQRVCSGESLDGKVIRKWLREDLLPDLYGICEKFLPKW